MSMIKIDLNHNASAGVYISRQPITTSKISDIVLVPQVLSIQKGLLEARPPWEPFANAYTWEFAYGSYAKVRYHRSGNIDNILQLYLTDWNINKIQEISDIRETLSLALIQDHIDKGLQAAICQQSTLCGVDIGCEMRLAFELADCEMIYR